MASLAIEEYLRLLPSVKQTGGGYLWMSYDAEADVLYVNFKNPVTPRTVNSRMMMSSSAMRAKRSLGSLFYMRASGSAWRLRG